MEINITDFFYTGQAHLYSASKGELGEDAGKLTWLNALSYSNKHRMLDTEDQLEAFKEFVRRTGGWTQEEISHWTNHELNALFVQFVAGDIREGGLSAPHQDWEQYQADCETGLVSGRIFKSEDNQVFYDIRS